MQALLDCGRYTLTLKMFLPRAGIDPLPIVERDLATALRRLRAFEQVPPDADATAHTVEILKHSGFYIIEFGVRTGECFWDPEEPGYIPVEAH